ncbi:MAG: glycerophosphodiester phosphodiesterase [Aggregatilineales bacterium]
MPVSSLPIRPPLMVHHMAALDGQTAPPNSLEAIRACLEAKADFVEIDVTALAHTDYLLVHDPALENETTGNGPVEACTPDEARLLRFARSGVPTNARVPLLSEVITLFRDYQTATRLQIDYKNMFPFPSDEPLRRLIQLIEPLQARVLVSAGADWQLRRLRALAPWLELGFDIGFYLDWRPAEEPVGPMTYPKQYGVYGFWDDHPLASHRFWPTAEYLADRCGAFIGLVPGASTFYISHLVLAHSLDDGFNWAEALHRAGIKLDAWTLDVDDALAVTNAKRLLAAGVDQFTSNTPGTLAALLAN